MRHRSKWRKRSDDSTIGVNNTSSLVNTTSSTHPSTTFTIHNNNNNVLSNLITNTSRLLHSKSTYFYKWWVNKNSDVYNSKRFSQQHSVKLSKSNPTGRDFDPLQPGYNALWKKRNWSYLLPTFCILSLLVGLYSFINPTTRHDSNSIRIDSSMLGLGSNKAYASDTDGVPVNNNTDVMSTRASDNNVSMTITPDTSSSGGSSSGTIDATVGQTAYSNHIVKLTGDRIKSYVLSISYTNDSTALVNNSTNTEEGAINSTITGANNKTGDNLDSNTWGYSWSDNTSTSSNTLTYHTMPISTNPATIKSATEGTIPNNTLNTEGKLAFAVKFGDKAVAGHYTTNVLLSLAVQPGEVVFDGITTMQQMTSTICSNAKENDEAILTDTRDNKKYWVTKLKDGNCWMTQNLAYDGGGVERAYNGSNKCTGWQDDNTVAQYCSPGHTDGDHASRGNYYSWPAAMNGNTSATGIVQGVCPNGWHLPTSNTATKGSFGGLTTTYGAGDNSSGSTIMRGSPMYFQYSGAANSGGILNVGSNGYYWSSTPSSSTNAYFLILASSSANPSNGSNRYLGFSVRCLVLDEETYTYTVSYKLKDGQVLHSDSRVPDTQTVTTTDGSYAFKVAFGPCLSTGSCGGNWTGDDGQTYASNGQVTLTPDKPTIVMTYNGGGNFNI